MEKIKYPDGSSYIRFGERESCANVTFRVNSYEDLWSLNQYVEIANHKGVIPTITIPNLIDAQADRRFGENSSSGLKLVCKFLNGMKANFKIFHPHNPEVVEAMMDNVEIIDNTQFIGTALIKLKHWNNHGNLVLMSADAGGFKPLTKLCDNIRWGGQIHSCAKGRSWDGTTSELTQRIGKEDFFGKDILIIDNLSVRGDTFKGLAKLLRQRNCGKLYLAVSHITVQNMGADPVTNYFDKVFTTNSKYDEYFTYAGSANRYQPKNLEIIKLFKDENRI